MYYYSSVIETFNLFWKYTVRFISHLVFKQFLIIDLLPAIYEVRLFFVTFCWRALNDGAWKTLYGWLQDAKSGLHKSFLVELLKLYRDLPVTVGLLKQNSCAKDIKHLIKCNDQG